MITDIHHCTESRFGNWKVELNDKYLPIQNIWHLLTNRDPLLISHCDIAWKGMNYPEQKISNRYYSCDISFPGIVAEDILNPYNKPYRLIDGSHRMARMTLETDIRESFFYVITADEFYDHLEDQLNE
jgi:hypothetical protein